MALPIYLLITILLIHLLFYIKKPLSFLQNSIVCLVAVFIATQYLTLIMMKFHLIGKSDDHWDYVAFLLYRNVFLPAVIIIFCNFFLRQSSWKNKTLLFIAALSVMVGIDWLSVKLGVISFIHWNFWFSGIVYALLLLIALGAMRLILYINVRESKQR